MLPYVGEGAGIGAAGCTLGFLGVWGFIFFLSFSAYREERGSVGR